MKVKLFLTLLLSSSIMLTTAACGASEQKGSDESSDASTAAEGTTTITETEAIMTKEKHYRFLFVGNSYTYYNELWSIFAEIAASAGYDVETDSVTSGGYYLDQFADPENEFGIELDKKLSENTYDYVFLQEQSAAPILEYDRFENGAQALYDKVKANGAQCILYQTWSRKPGHYLLDDNGWTYEFMAKGLADGYAKMAEKLQVEVSPVGTAFYEVFTKYPEIELYSADLTHPSYLGSYLAALCHFVTVTGEDPANVTYKEKHMRDDTVDVLKSVVREVVLGK